MLTGVRIRPTFMSVVPQTDVSFTWTFLSLVNDRCIRTVEERREPHQAHPPSAQRIVNLLPPGVIIFLVAVLARVVLAQHRSVLVWRGGRSGPEGYSRQDAREDRGLWVFISFGLGGHEAPDKRYGAEELANEHAVDQL